MLRHRTTELFGVHNRNGAFVVTCHVMADADGEAETLVDLGCGIGGDLVAAAHLRERVAGELARGGGLLAALELLDSGLERDPGAASLLAERGWLLAGTGDPGLVAVKLVSLDAAVLAGPDNPYALAYRALVNGVLLGRPEAAWEDSEAFFGLRDRPTGLADLLADQGLGPER